MEVDNIANFFSIMAIICGISLRGPQVYKIYTTNPLSVILSIVMNSCILFYMIIHSQYPMIAYCSIMILLELLLIYMKGSHGKMKKSSSQTNLLEMEKIFH